MLGIDIVEIKRVKKIYQKHGLLFLEKILNNDEINSLPVQNSRNFLKIIACYIACKEAIFKACSEESLDWQEITIRNITNKPLISIKRPDFKKKVKVTLGADGDVVLSQAFIV